MRSVAPSAPAADDPHPSRLVLRDGTVTAIRVADRPDCEPVAVFFRQLSPESRYRRFLSTQQPAPDLIARFCDAADPAHTLTLIASRRAGGAEHIVAVASYMAVTRTTAEAAFAVSEDFQGKGIGTLLLEHLAARALANGFTQFHATTLAENAPMLDVFRESGFEIRSKFDKGCEEVELSLALPLGGVAAAESRRQRATIASLRSILTPAAVAVIGASRDSTKIGSRILRALKNAGFRGGLHAVHPTAEALEGVAACASARDLPAGLDLAVLAVPARSVPAVVDDCAVAGVKSLLVVTAGFAEIGPEGRRAQDALVEKVRGYGMRMVGPNCLGVLNTSDSIRLNASFCPIFPARGRVAFSSQSGALGIAVLELAAARHIGFSSFVSVGNKADVSGNDLLEYWGGDPDTSVILLYLESFGNPRRFARIARRVGRAKPIVALKSGRTRAGSRAAGSHTAALASNDAAVAALFRQTGVIRAETIDEMFDIAACLDTQPLPRGSRIAIVTNAGGPGILAADACEAAGLTMATLSKPTRQRLAALLPATASLDNPVDMVAAAGPAEFEGAAAATLADPGVDAVIPIYTPVDVTKSAAVLEGIARGIQTARALGASQKPVLACLMSAALRGNPFRAGRERIPSYAFPEQAVRALGKIAAYAAWREQPASLYWDFEDVQADEARLVCRAALATRGPDWLTFDESAAVLRAFGLPVVASGVARTEDEAVAIASVVGYPVAAKLMGTAAAHKTDIGGVQLNLAGAAAVRQAFADLTARAAAVGLRVAAGGVLIQSMVAGGVETMVGISHDPVFGPLVGFGIGGVDVEWQADVRFRVAPLTDRDTEELLHEIRGFRLLEGYRGRPPADLDGLRDILLRTSRLAEELPEIAELDLNPVIALSPGNGCRIVDARIRVIAPAGSRPS